MGRLSSTGTPISGAWDQRGVGPGRDSLPPGQMDVGLGLENFTDKPVDTPPDEG